MASVWLSVFLSAVITHGLFAFSPVPVPEDEWEEFSEMLRNPEYRLPRTSTPQRYELTLTPYLDVVPSPNIMPFTFEGVVAIQLTVHETTSELVLHCNDLEIQELSLSSSNGVPIPLQSTNFTCEMPYSFLRVQTTTQLPANTEYILRSTFTGNLQTNMRGFYRSWYKDSTGQKRWLGTTQFQPGHARQAFPCYDEPSFKAYFDITINRDSGLQPTVSNMPINTTTTVSGRTSETFYTTPKTSTYLLGFIVSDFERVATNNNATHPFHIYARNTAGTTGNYALEFGIKLLDIMTAYTGILYYEMADNIDMKQGAIPDFSAGAMENWGILTYREAFLLYDENNSNHWYKQRIANVIGHEVAHQWFGNLVTCAWWDNLWLNEAFGRFYQYYLAEMGDPEMGFNARFVVEQIRESMLSDSVDSAHALTNPDVSDPASVSAHFSTITYAKGASMLRMTQYLLDNDTFVKGLRKFLEARKFDVAEPHHLFSALDEAAEEDNALANYGGVTIDSYLRTWTERAGHPLLTVSVNQNTGNVLINQARWERDTGVSQFNQIWEIPVTWTRANAVDFDDLKPQLVIRDSATSFYKGSTSLEWILLNKQQTSFYRVNYDHNNWVLLTRALKSNSRTVIHEFNRAQIVDDLFNFARAGLHNYARIFNILSFLELEDQYTPWISAITGFNFARSRLAYDTATLQRLNDHILSLSRAIVARLGYVERPGEDFMDGLLRMHVMNFLCDVGDEGCLSTATTTFQQWRNGGTIYANMRPWVYCNGLRQGTAEDFAFFWNNYLNEELATEVVVMLSAAGCTKDVASLETFLNAIINIEETIRPQDVATALSSAVTRNEENAMIVLDWLKRNLSQVIDRLGSATTFVSNIAARLRNEEQITEFQTWLDEQRETLGAAYTTGVDTIATIRNNINWTTRRANEFNTYFDTGYVEESLVDEEAEEDNEEEDNVEEEDDDDGNNASVAAMSTFILLLMFTVNIMFA